MDVLNIVTLGVVALGAVNVLGMFFPTADSRIKWGLSFVVALVFLFIPASLGNAIMDKIVIALEVALGASGAYKVATKAGGN